MQFRLTSPALLSEEMNMKKLLKILAVLAAAATLGLGMTSCDYWKEDWYKDGDPKVQTASYTAASISDVGTDYVSGKTFDITVEGANYTITFATSGTTGTVTKGTVSGTVTYNGDVLNFTLPSDTFYGWLRKINNEYYLSLTRLVKDDGSSGLPGRWIWESGTPSGFISAFIFHSNGRMQREDDGRWATWRCDDNGVLYYRWEETGQEASDSGHDVYTGPYIFTPDVPFTPRP